MKKLTAVILIMAMVFPANFAFAGDVDIDGDGDHIGIGIDNVNTNTNTANANAEANAQQEQNQEQQQQQAQVMNFNNVRQHITALPGTAGNFVAAPTAMLSGWTALACNPLFSTFSAERIRQMEKADSSFWGGVKVKKVVHVPGNGKKDDRPINLVGFDAREGAYVGDQLLGEFECQGEYGMPMGASLGRCLAQAKQDTGTSRVFAAYRVRKDPKNSGFSIGSGVGAAALSGSPDNKAGAIALGGLIGTTRAKIDEAYDWTVLALNDGPLGQCGAPPALPPVVQTPPPAPCPVPVPSASPTCDVTEIQKRITELEQKIRECTRFCLNNLCLRYQLGDAYVDWYTCTGDKRHLVEAIKHYEIAERNYLKGHDIAANQAEANRILAQVYYNWAGALYELQGREAAIAFAHQKHLERIPTGFRSLK